jgi:predicted DNA-binding transcriptional regulator AlpA
MSTEKREAVDREAVRTRRADRSKRPQGVIWPGDLERFYGISLSTRWRWEREGQLPARNVHIGGGGWLADTMPEVARWLAEHAS